jgi:hypothetical protein
LLAGFNARPLCAKRQASRCEGRLHGSRDVLPRSIYAAALWFCRCLFEELVDAMRWLSDDRPLPAKPDSWTFARSALWPLWLEGHPQEDSRKVSMSRA